MNRGAHGRQGDMLARSSRDRWRIAWEKPSWRSYGAEIALVTYIILFVLVLAPSVPNLKQDLIRGVNELYPLVFAIIIFVVITAVLLGIRIRRR